MSELDCQRYSDLLQLFSLASSIFPIFIFYLKNFNLLRYEELEKTRHPKRYAVNLERIEKRTDRFRYAANALLGCWVITLLFFVLVHYWLHSIPTEIVFMENATFTQLVIVFAISALLLLNLVFSHLENWTRDILKNQGFLDELILPQLFFELRTLGIFMFYAILFFSVLLGYFPIWLIIFIWGLTWISVDTLIKAFLKKKKKDIKKLPGILQWLYRTLRRYYFQKS